MDPKRMLVNFVLSHVIKMQWASGYRMYGVGAAMVFAGLGALAHEFATGGYDDKVFWNGLELIAGGIGIIGAAGKADKIAAAMTAKKE